MSNRKNLIIILAVSYFILTSSLMNPQANGWENKLTHSSITQKAVERSVLDDFLKNQLGFNQGLDMQLKLTNQNQINIDMRILQESEFEWDNKTIVSILEWLRRGSVLEDVPNPRARHHFYDPIRNTGLNNSDTIFQPVIDILYLGSLWFYPTYWGFDATGLSALDRARGFDGDWGNEYPNNYNWINARSLFYSGLTEQSGATRETYLGSMFLVLGHICHLLEDMGVPAHTRNDFIRGHLIAGFYEDLTKIQKPWYKGGHPFEAWMEELIRINNKQIPDIYLSRLMETPPVFSQFEDYWDTGVCELSGNSQWQGDSSGWPDSGLGKPPPEKTWGLAECTNYQFLSYSTMFKISGLQSFPHPAKEHTRLDWYFINDKKQYYRIGYDVPHLARKTFTNYVANIKGITLSITPETTEDKKVYEDYAKRTIPRTIDYTTGLINYFFRGRIEADVTGYDGNQIEVTIKNVSQNSGVEQILKGGTFELYWDDQDGNRFPVSGPVTVQDPTSGNWDSNSVLACNGTTTIKFTPEVPLEGQYIDKYVVVYRGGIQTGADNPDSDDMNALATASFYCGTLLAGFDYPYISWCDCEPSDCYCPSSCACLRVCGDLSLIVYIWNISNKSGSPQNLEDGIFEVYYKDMQDQLILLTAVSGSLDYCYEWFEGWEEWPPQPVLQIDLGEVEYTPAKNLLVVYKGQMVDSGNPTDEYYGTSIGSIEIGEIGLDESCFGLQ